MVIVEFEFYQMFVEVVQVGYFKFDDKDGILDVVVIMGICIICDDEDI